MNNRPEIALRWLEEAIIQVSENQNDTESSNQQSSLGVKSSQIEQVLRQVRRKLPPGYEAMVEAEKEADEEREQEDKYRLGNIPPVSRNTKQ